MHTAQLLWACGEPQRTFSSLQFRNHRMNSFLSGLAQSSANTHTLTHTIALSSHAPLSRLVPRKLVRAQSARGGWGCPPVPAILLCVPYRSLDNSLLFRFDYPLSLPSMPIAKGYAQRGEVLYIRRAVYVQPSRNYVQTTRSEVFTTSRLCRDFGRFHVKISFATHIALMSLRTRLEFSQLQASETPPA